MPDEMNITRDELAQLRPLTHLRGYGCLDESGEPRKDLTGTFATAACITFENGELAPQELATVYEAIKQCLEASNEKDPAERFRQAVDHALDVCAELLNKEINDSLVDWIYEWFPLIESATCIDAFLKHMNAVVKQYAVVMGLKSRV